LFFVAVVRVSANLSTGTLQLTNTFSFEGTLFTESSKSKKFHNPASNLYGTSTALYVHARIINCQSLQTLLNTQPKQTPYTMSAEQTSDKTRSQEDFTSPQLQGVASKPSTIQNPPTTPERKKRLDITRVPKTPPNQDFSRFITQETPTDHSDTVLLPSTPSNDLDFQAQSLSRISNVPQTPSFKGLGISGSNQEASPLKSPSDGKEEADDTNPPIRHISSALKTRLSYAFVKFQKGWANQSLDELEKNLGQSDDVFKTKDSHAKAAQKNISPAKVVKPIKSPQRSMKIEQPTVLLNNGRRFSEDEDLIAAEDDGSANAAFLQAISKSRSPKTRQNNPHPPPLRLDPVSLNKEYNPEADAIQTLMSLSSPQSFKNSQELASPSQSSRPLPRQRLSFGEKLSPEKATFKNQSSANDETDVETDIETDGNEASSDSSVITKTKVKRKPSSSDIAANGMGYNDADEVTTSESE
jgi:hypothetical protein